jgi:hypothetical protein
VKFLIDTPEATWGLLDGGAVLAAACRLAGARCVYARLAAAKAQRTLRRQFKLLEHQEDAIEQKRGDVVAAADAQLRSLGGGVEMFADAAAARVLLADDDAPAALRHFLECRRAAVEQCARGERGGSADAGDGAGAAAPLTRRLARLASMLQELVWQVAVLFMEPHVVSFGAERGTDTQVPAVARALAEGQGADGAAEPRFDALEAREGEGVQSEEAEWHAVCASARERAAALGPGAVGPVVVGWLEGVSGAAAVAFERGATCAELAVAAEEVQASIREWRAPSEGEGREGMPWPSLASAVLGQRIDLWAAAFEPGLRRRAGSLLHAGIQRAILAPALGLAEPLAAAKAAGAAEPGGGGAAGAAWSALAASAAVAPLAAVAASADTDTSANATAHVGAWRSTLPLIERQVLADLGAALADAGALAASRHMGGRAAAAQAARSDALRVRAQQSCAAAMAELASVLEEQLGKLQSEESAGCASHSGVGELLCYAADSCCSVFLVTSTPARGGCAVRMQSGGRTAAGWTDSSCVPAARCCASCAAVDTSRVAARSGWRGWRGSQRPLSLGRHTQGSAAWRSKRCCRAACACS